MKALAQSTVHLEAQGKGGRAEDGDQVPSSDNRGTRSHKTGPVTSESGTGVNEQEVEAVGEHSGGFHVLDVKTSSVQLSHRRRAEGGQTQAQSSNPRPSTSGSDCSTRVSKQRSARKDQDPLVVVVVVVAPLWLLSLPVAIFTSLRPD